MVVSPLDRPDEGPGRRSGPPRGRRRPARFDASTAPRPGRSTTTSATAGSSCCTSPPSGWPAGRLVETLSRHEVALLAIDEAHCISEWGHNFRPEYLKLAGLADRLRVGRVLALTATATPEVARDIARSLAIVPTTSSVTGFHRPNLELHATPCRADDRLEL